jgi:hypothetical protein
MSAGNFLDLPEIGDFDEALFTEVLAHMVAAHPDQQIRDVAERSPGLNVRKLEDGRLEVFLIDLDETEVVVGRVAPEDLRHVPPMPPASSN